MSDDVTEPCGRDRTHGTPEVDSERGRIEGPKICDLVRCIDDHASLLDKWQPKDCVDGDVRATRDAEMGWMTLAGQIRKVELESNGQLGGY